MRRIIKLITLLTLVLALLVQAACAEPAPTLKAVYDALLAEGSDYSQFKAMYAEYFPGIEYTETLRDDGFTLAISGNEYFNGSWDFALDGDYLTAEMDAEDLSGVMLIIYLIDAVADVHGMNPHLVNSYVNGMNAHDMTSDDFAMTMDENGTSVRLNIARPWAMAELDQLALDEAALQYEPLSEEFTSMASSCGKMMMVANGNVDGVKILIGEYGGLDELALTSMINVVNVLKPNGCEDFIANYTELADASAEGYSVNLNLRMDTVGEIIDDASEDYSYALIRFGTENDGLAEAGVNEYDPPAPEEPPTVEALTEDYFKVVAGLEVDRAGGSLATAICASKVCAFAEAYSLYNPDVEPLRANLLDAFEAMDKDSQNAFLTNFDAVRDLLEACLEDYDAQRGIFEDAGVVDTMDRIMYDPLNRLAWMHLRDYTMTMGNSDD